ncbi:hypothetical protein V2J09_016208 [Rumex salicifolius]
MGDCSAIVSAILVYPIKSCRGISVPQAPVSSTGFRWDRQWLIINPNGRMYTQRVEPKLALIEVELPREAFSDSFEPSTSSFLVVRVPGMSALKVPLSNSGVRVEGVGVWNWTGSALDEGDEPAHWLSTYLGKTARLVRFDAARATRETHPDYAPGYRTMFSDENPFLLASQGSLDALNKLLPNPIPINRFRPNIVVEGCEPFEEDVWNEFKINKLTFNGVKLCSRCKVPTINQETGVDSPEVSQVLKTHRSGKVLRPNRNKQGEVYFGQNLVCNDSLAGGKGKLIQVGDPVYVIQKYTCTAEAPA